MLQQAGKTAKKHEYNNNLVPMGNNGAKSGAEHATRRRGGNNPAPMRVFFREAGVS
ncbi:hypothetical protein BRO54_1021 [Geobacillus proteiniphilus]|uniref:Uncharacterized protein n=1 Tax=Geobacillus proteiniphilus TaxID=860353 RepID=A0A1Q5T575_9BACL|nr:hypothetical protein BRO54_1021 [Geobacillus proteiniphilus]